MSKEREGDHLWSAGIIILLFAVGVFLVTERGRGLDANYVYTFALFAFLAIVGGGFMWFWASQSNEGDDDFEPIFVDGSRIGSNWIVRLVVAIVLMLIFTGGLLGTQKAIIPVINPYAAGELIDPGSQLFSSEGTFKTGLRTGAYAGIIEDLLGMAFCLAVTWLLLKFVWSRIDDDATSDGLWITVSAIIACVAWGFVFSTAHQEVYGTDQEAYLAAFVFGTVGQMANLATGFPVSILAHFTHNFVVIVGFSIALSISSAAAFVPWYRRKQQGGHRMVTDRKGQAVPWIAGIALVILLILGALWTWGIPGWSWLPGEAFSTVAPACMDWTAVPDVPSCSSDADCLSAITGGEPLDSGTALRCNDGVCEAKFTVCEAEVSA